MGIIFVFSLLTLVGAFPNGAPPGICQREPTELPSPNHHGIKAQTGPPPYNVYSSVHDKKLIVTIESTSQQADIRGFLVYFEDNSIAGSWENDDVSHPLSCGSVTHDNKRKKQLVKLEWTPTTPVSFKDLKLRAVIVKDFATFWINIPVGFRGEFPDTMTPLVSPSTTTTSTRLADLSTAQTTSTRPTTTTTSSTAQTTTTRPTTTSSTAQTISTRAKTTTSSTAQTTSTRPTTTTSSTTTAKPSHADADNPWSSLLNFNKESSSTSTASTTSTARSPQIENKAKPNDPWFDLLEFNQDKMTSKPSLALNPTKEPTSTSTTTTQNPSKLSATAFINLSTATTKHSTTLTPTKFPATASTTPSTTTTKHSATLTPTKFPATASTTPTTTTKSPGFFSRLFGKSNKKSSSTASTDNSQIITTSSVVENQPSTVTPSSENKSVFKEIFSG